MRHAGRPAAGARTAACLAGFALGFVAPPPASADTYPVSVAGFRGEEALDRPAAVFYQPSLGETFVADAGHSRIAIYDSTGRFTADVAVRSLGPAPRRAAPCAVAADERGRIFVVSNADPEVQVLDLRGERIGVIASPELRSPPPRAQLLFVDAQGNLHVVWHGAQAPWTVFDPELRLARSSGSTGPGPEDFQRPTAIWVDAAGRAYVCDAVAVPAVKVFGPGGDYLAGFGGHDIEEGDFSMPSGVATTADGSIWVADRLRQVIKRFDSGGRFLTMIGGWGKKPGELQFPSGLAGDGNDRLTVIENGGQRFQTYTVPLEHVKVARRD